MGDASDDPGEILVGDDQFAGELSSRLVTGVRFAKI
jgi:hypothetical protein